MAWWTWTGVGSPWVAGSVVVDGNVDSERPTWLMRARKGSRWVDLASGPLVTRRVAERLAVTLNEMPVERWDRFIETALREVLSGAWG